MRWRGVRSPERDYSSASVTRACAGFRAEPLGVGSSDVSGNEHPSVHDGAGPEERDDSHGGEPLVGADNQKPSPREDEEQRADRERPKGVVVQCLVDGLSRAIGKQVKNPGETAFTFKQGFVYENQLRVVAELDDAGAVKSRFVYGDRPNVSEYMVQGSETHRIVTDYLGCVGLVVNASDGTIAQKIDYDSFGRIAPGGDTNPGFPPFGFAGGLYDADLPSVPGTGFV